MARRIAEGDYAIIYMGPGKSALVRVTSDGVFHSHLGCIRLGELVGREYGIALRTHIGERVYVFSPTPKDYIDHIRRPTQILYPKDIGIIVLYTGIGPGSIVVEAGTGSGALTGVLAYMVRPTGRVYSYEVRKEFIEIARRNLEILGVAQYVTLKHKDITEGIDERDVDAVILDMPTPWEVVPHAYEALRGGGFFVSFSPTINQVERTVETLREHGGFRDIEVVETFIRRWKVKRGETRPETFMVGHTGYLVFARKILRADKSGWREEKGYERAMH